MADETKTGAEEKPEVDYEALLKAKDDEIAKISSDRDNYRKGLLKAKGKLSDDEAGETDDERIARIVQEQLHTSDAARIQREKDELISRMARELKETKVALKNRAQVGATAAGAGQDKPEVTTEFWTAEQKAAMRRTYDVLPGKKGTFEEFLAKTQANYLKTKQS